MSNITINCPRCGANEFTVPRRDVQLSDHVTCAKCGYSDTRGNITKAAAKKLAERSLKDVFKNRTINIKL